MLLVSSACVEWTGSLDSHGYGLKRIDGRLQLVHRLAWAEVHGTIPDGMLICHHCDNSACYNVAHLFCGTYSDNLHDAWNRGRRRRAEHGSLRMYNEYRCRCDACRDVMNASQRKRYHARRLNEASAGRD